jgi:hypothetical protein
MPDLDIFAVSRLSFSDGYGFPIPPTFNRLVSNQQPRLIEKKQPVYSHDTPT